MDVTIVIPALNAEQFIEELLSRLEQQDTKLDYEVLVIDSGSTDSTLEIVGRHKKVRLEQIPNADFGHGRTRNLGAKLAKGKFVLYLTQDAWPTGDYWLEAMVEPFMLSDKVGCVVGKQIPHADAPATIKREVTMVFRGLGPDDSISLQRKNGLTDNRKLVNTFLSNTNSAVRKDLLEKIPFRDVNYAEDQGLAIDLLEAGYYKAYSPLGAVDHSHDYGVREYFGRKFDEYVGLYKTTGYRARADLRELILGSAKATIRDWQFIVRDRQYGPGLKLKNFFTSPLYNIGLRLAIRSAASERVTAKYHDKLSLEKKIRKGAKN